MPSVFKLFQGVSDIFKEFQEYFRELKELSEFQIYSRKFQVRSWDIPVDFKNVSGVFKAFHGYYRAVTGVSRGCFRGFWDFPWSIERVLSSPRSYMTTPVQQS